MYENDRTSLGGGHVSFTHTDAKNRIIMLFKEVIVFDALKRSEVLCHFKKRKFKKRLCTRVLDFYTDHVFILKFFQMSDSASDHRLCLAAVANLEHLDFCHTAITLAFTS